jgi:hypothetical protein
LLFSVVTGRVCDTAGAAVTEGSRFGPGDGLRGEWRLGREGH